MDEELKNLREALRITPDNIPLRKYLADLLIKKQKYEEAETEYKEALKQSGDDENLKIGLANSFYHQKKTSAGLVLLEDIIDNKNISPQAFLVYAKLLYDAGQYEQAREAYHTAVIRDHNLTDDDFEARLNDKKESSTPQEPEKVRVQDTPPDDDERDVEIEKPHVNFDHVGGMEGIKKEIRMKIIHPLEHPDIYKAYGKAIGGGVLLYGPPGCGKTHIAKATAGEVNANFISVGISDILDIYLGQSEQNLHAIFEKARQVKPCVLFFDEVDALGASRTDMKQSASRKLINQFLSELDGVESSNDGVLILAATNAPWHLDTAFRRPGRFDRIIFTPPPDTKAREAIFRIMLKDKPIESIDYKTLAKKTQDFSGADIKAVIDIAVEDKLEQSMQQGIPLPLTNKDILAAIKKHNASVSEWFATAKNYALFANEAGIYDEILRYLKITKK